jgi:hypothetical protein
MSEHRDTRKAGAGGSIPPGGRAAAAARGTWRGGPAWYVFEAGTMNRAALRAELERLRPRPLKAQFARTSRP